MASTSSAIWSSEQMPTSGQTNSVASHLTHCLLRFGSSSALPLKPGKTTHQIFRRDPPDNYINIATFRFVTASPTSKTWHVGRAAVWLQLFIHQQHPGPHCWKRKGRGHSLQHACAFGNVIHARVCWKTWETEKRSALIGWNKNGTDMLVAWGYQVQLQNTLCGRKTRYTSLSSEPAWTSSWYDTCSKSGKIKTLW